MIECMYKEGQTDKCTNHSANTHTHLHPSYYYYVFMFIAFNSSQMLDRTPVPFSGATMATCFGINPSVSHLMAAQYSLLVAVETEHFI